MGSAMAGRGAWVVALGILMGLSAISAAMAQSVPRFNVNPGCSGPVEAGLPDLKSCIQDEQTARDQLVKDWTTFKAADRSSCTVAASSGGIHSYIELLVCLQMSKQAQQSAQPARGVSPHRGHRRT